MQQAHFQKIPGNPWHQEWGHCLSLAVEPLCWELVNHCWKWASERDTQHRNLCNNDEKAISSAQFFCSFPLHFQSNCKPIPVEERAKQRCSRKRDSNSIAGTSGTAHPPHGDTSMESVSHQHTALLTFPGASWEWRAVTPQPCAATSALGLDSLAWQGWFLARAV